MSEFDHQSTQGAFLGSRDYLRIFQFHRSEIDRLVSRESTWLEFKESFNWLNKPLYARSVAAFANRQGGYMIFGVSSKPHKLVGLKSEKFEELDEAKIAEYLNQFFAPEIQFQKFTIELNEKKIGILRVEPCKGRPIICQRSDKDITEGHIYFRYNARSECIKFPELKMILDVAKENERQRWMEHLQKISHIGIENAAICDLNAGEISASGGKILIDSKLLAKIKFIKSGSFHETGSPTLRLIGDVTPTPVVAMTSSDFQITDNPDAPSVKIEEDELLQKHFPMDFEKLNKKMTTHFSDFKVNNAYHKIRKEFMKDATLYRERFLDPGNPNSSKKGFYSPLIIKRFEKHYTPRKQFAK